MQPSREFSPLVAVLLPSIQSRLLLPSVAVFSSPSTMAAESPSKADRVWADGCYDMVHFGHANQLRQSKLFGRKLVVGVHNDAEVTLHKGPPVFNEQERYRMVVEDAPYSTTIDTLDKHNCDFCVHGDDITLTAEGTDTYEEVKKAGRYRECKRTAGVSTTDLVGRMLLLTKSHHALDDSIDEHRDNAKTLSTNTEAESPWTRVSRFLPTTRTLLEFAEGRPPHPSDKIVYVCGAFDLFHIGHLSFLEEAAKLGDYLIVGILSDQVVNEYKGSNHPIMNLHERVLSVLAYRPVSEVVIGAPYGVTNEMIDHFKINVVAQGSRLPHHRVGGPDAFGPAKQRGIYAEVDSHSDMTTKKIIKRIIDHRLEYEERNQKKEKKEIAAVEALRKIQSDEGGKLNTMASVRIDLPAH